MTTTFETIITQLREKGMTPTDPEVIPSSTKSPIPVHCLRHHEHHFVWDMKFIMKRLQDDSYASYNTLCFTCIGNMIVQREAEELCQRIHVELVTISDDKKIYHYRLPCGHEQSSQKKHIKNMTHPPFCRICLENRRSQCDPLEYPLLKKFHAKIQRYRKKSLNFTEKIPEIIAHIHKRLTDMNIDMLQIGFDDEENDLWIYMRCEGDEYCHRNTIHLLEMVERLKYVNLGSQKSVCHECCRQE
jgi:hypothetical protein